MVEQHARGLAKRGHHVTLIMPHSFGGLASWARAAAVEMWNRVQQTTQPDWPEDAIERLEPRKFREVDLKLFDAVIATGYQTAGPVSRQVEGGFYFLQGDETTLARGAGKTWRLPLRRFAVSEWLSDRVEASGSSVIGVVPNAVDPEMWACDRALDRRGDRVIALYHRHPVKGPRVLIRALEELRRSRPSIRADVFAARTPRHDFPDWVRVRVRPSPDVLRKMYNRAAVCLHTSRVEGWGLVPMEAAACGCAIVGTASQGPREYLTPGVSMAEVPVGDHAGLAREAARLLRDPAAREAQAQAGMDAVSRFCWSDSTDVLERILMEGCG